MNQSRTNVVDGSRLVGPRWEEGKRLGAGDIHASYSAHTIASQSIVRKPFKWRGEAWIAVGLSGIGGVQQADAFRLVAAGLFQGAVNTYRLRCGNERAARLARRDPMGFYHGMRVRHNGAAYVLVGPEETFVAGTTPSIEDPLPYLCLNDSAFCTPMGNHSAQEGENHGIPISRATISLSARRQTSRND